MDGFGFGFRLRFWEACLNFMSFFITWLGLAEHI